MGTWVEMKARSMGFESAHLTLIYWHDLSDEKREKVEQVIREVNDTVEPLAVRPTGIEMFGPKKDIPVVRVWAGNHLRSIRRKLETVAPSDSEYGFNPHITLMGFGNFSIVIPPVILLGRMELMGGETFSPRPA